MSEEFDIKEKIYWAMANLFDELDTLEPSPLPKNAKGGASVVARMTDAAVKEYIEWYKQFSR